MKIAYEYSLPNDTQLKRLGLDASSLMEIAGCAVTAYDGEEAIGFGFMQKECSTPDNCRILVMPAYDARQIDRNIMKLLKARSC